MPIKVFQIISGTGPDVLYALDNQNRLWGFSTEGVWYQIKLPEAPAIED